MDEWMHISIEVPADDGGALLLLLHDKLGFTETDWCELTRPDGARIFYGPLGDVPDRGAAMAPQRLAEIRSTYAHYGEPKPRTAVEHIRELLEEVERLRGKWGEASSTAAGPPTTSSPEGSVGRQP